MKFRLIEGMEFVAKDNKSAFETKMYDYYGDGTSELCAFTQNSIYPISEIHLDDYNIVVEHKTVNGKIEFDDKGIDISLIEEYKYLERLRQSGVVNMFGAGQYLQDVFDMTKNEAKLVLSNWMNNYSDLVRLFGWVR